MFSPFPGSFLGSPLTPAPGSESDHPVLEAGRSGGKSDLQTIHTSPESRTKSQLTWIPPRKTELIYSSAFELAGSRDFVFLAVQKCRVLNSTLNPFKSFGIRRL